MRKQRFLWPSLLLAALILTVSASADGDPLPGRVEPANRSHSGSSFSCDVKLSGTAAQGELFAALYAESDRVKSLSAYPAAPTVKVELSNVDKTDYIKLLWVDANHMPLANPVQLRMEDNGAAAYERFAQELADLAALAPSGGEGLSDVENPYALMRLLMSCYSLPDLSAYKGKMTMISGPDNFYVLQFNDPDTEMKCEKYLRKCPSVRYVQPDVILREDNRNKPKESAVLQGDVSAPPWGVTQTRIREYAEYLGKKGGTSSVIVAVVDSGVNAKGHPSLQERLVEGRNFVERENASLDTNGHGTHVAGTIVDCTPNMDVKIMPVRVLNAFNSGSLLGIYNGICHAREHGANVINLSLKLNVSYPPIEDAINAAISKNITVVVAAGNDNGNAKNCSPANIESCITVAALDKNLKRYEKSNFGEAVDIAAPGVAVESCWLGGKRVELDGTSMAAPHVSAAAALLLCERGFTQTPEQISDALKRAAKALPEDSDDAQWDLYRKIGHEWSDFLGAGFLDMSPFLPRTVTLDANDGSGRTTVITVSAETPFEEPDNPFDRTDYTFAGWFADADAKIPFDFSKPIGVDTRIYAGWDKPEPVRRTITLRFGDAQWTDSDADLQGYGDVAGRTVLAVPIVATTSDGQPFDMGGCEFQVDFSGLAYRDIEDEGCGVLGFVGNGKDFLSVSATTEANANANGFVKALFSDTRARNFTVKNNQVIAKIVFWPDESGKEIAPRLSFREGARVSAVDADKNPVPYAVSATDEMGLPPYPVESVKVTFDANGGAFGDGATTQTVVINKGETVTPPENPTRYNSSFIVWRDAITKISVDFSQPIYADTTIYADWDKPEPVRQTITLRFGDAQWTDSDADLQGYGDVAGRTVLAVPIVAESSDGQPFDMGGCEFQVDFSGLAYRDIEDEGCGVLGFVGNGKDFLSVSATTEANANANGFVKALFSDTRARNFTVENNQVIAKIVFWPDESGKEIAPRLSFREGARVSAVDADKNPVPYAVSATGEMELPPYPGEEEAAYALLYDDGEMIFQNGSASNPDRKLLHEAYPVPTKGGTGQYAGWHSLRDKIRTVTFADAIRPLSTDLWFYGFSNLTEVRGLENLDLSEATSARQMFALCTSLTELDLSGLDTKNVTNMGQMFFRCASLNAIYASDSFNVANVTESADMFTGCASLIGGSGTNYDDAHTDKEYAHIDDGAYDHGYFSDKTSLLFDGVELYYKLIDAEPADNGMNIEIEANETCVMGETLVVSATISTPDAYEAGSHKYIGYFAYENRGKWEWQQLRAWHIDGGQSVYTLEIPVKSCPRMGSNTFTVSVFPADNFSTGASLLDRHFFVDMRRAS